MSTITVPHSLLQRCFAHGAGTYPQEGCGVLSGPAEGDGLDRFDPVPNVIDELHAQDPERYPRTSREGYVLDPGGLYRLEKELAGQGRRIKVIFHSHVDVGAYFSPEDSKRALWAGEPLLPGMVYLVCGIREGQPDGAILASFDPVRRDFVSVSLASA